MSEHYLKLRSHAKISVENQNGHSLELCNLVMKYNCLIAHATYTMYNVTYTMYIVKCHPSIPGPIQPNPLIGLIF